MKTAQELLKSRNKFIIKLGLERIGAILSLLDNPQENYKIIHIAGTNGKGSTSKIINDILIQQGFKTGLFTSPHLFCYEERIRVDNEKIPSSIFDETINKIDNLAHKNGIELSEFELLCAAAFYYFSKKKVDFVVLEVGLGGLYDATNIIKNPEISIITTIDSDHTERLGNTIEQIAFQKAGIIKRNCPVIVSKENLGYEVIKKQAALKNSPLVPLLKVEVEYDGNKNYAFINNKKYDFNLLGSHQAENLALAYSSAKYLKIDDSIIELALKKVKWPYRLEYHPKQNILIDCAHNPSGIKTLRDFLDDNFQNIKKRFIFGCLENKDYNTMLNILLKEGDELNFCEFSHPAALKFSKLNPKYSAKLIKNIDEIINSDGLKIFCGSIYMLGEILKNHSF